MAPALQTLIALAALCIPITFAKSLSELFTVDASCAGRGLDTALADAQTLLAAARTAITNLEGSKTFVSTATRNYMRNAHNTFGTTYYPKRTTSGLTSGDTSTLNTVSANYQLIQNLLAGNPVNGRTLSTAGAYITCESADPANTRYKTTMNAVDIDPTQTGKSVQDSYGVPFVYYVAGNKNANNIETVVMRPAAKLVNNGGPICSQYLAYTTAPDSFITFEPRIQIVLCPNLFDSTMWKQSLSVTVPSKDQKANWKFLGGGFLHELFHIAGDNFSDRQFARKSDGFEFQLYGARAADAISNHPGDYEVVDFGDITTIDQPDAYRLFAEECQFRGTTWSVDASGL